MEQKIVAKILEIQKGTLSQDIGLFNGDMGICLALYLSRMAKDMPLSAETETHADKLLEHIISEARNAINPAFDNGLSGIGWAINFLHAHKCIEGDIDDILYNIDASIYKELTKKSRHTKHLSCQRTAGVSRLLYRPTGKHKAQNQYHST